MVWPSGTHADGEERRALLLHDIGIPTLFARRDRARQAGAQRAAYSVDVRLDYGIVFCGGRCLHGVYPFIRMADVQIFAQSDIVQRLSFLPNKCRWTSMVHLGLPIRAFDDGVCGKTSAMAVGLRGYAIALDGLYVA